MQLYGKDAFKISFSQHCSSVVKKIQVIIGMKPLCLHQSIQAVSVSLVT